MKKIGFSTEMAYIIGLISLAIGTAMMERADFGVSMIVAPAYLIYLKLSQYFPGFTFGMAEYSFQAFLIIILSLVLFSFKRKYLFSFVTAFIYGNILDLCMLILEFIPQAGIFQRLAFYICGMVICAVGVAFLFRTYITPEAYELFVMEVAEKYKKENHIVKMFYDCSSCLIAILMSFAFFGFMVFKGVNWGTVVCALINGWLIGKISNLLNNHLEFKDSLTIKKYFE